MYYIVSELEYSEPAVRIVDTSDNSVQDMSIAELVGYIQNGSMLIENAIVENGKLRMLNGDLSKYGKIRIGETSDDDVVLSNAIVVLEELVNTDGVIIGYTVSDTVGEIGDYSLEDMLLLAKKYKFANGSFVSAGSEKYMMSAEKPYPRVTVEDTDEADEADEVEKTEEVKEAVAPVIPEEDTEKNIKMLILKDGQERTTRVRISEFDKAMEVIGYHGVILTDIGEGKVLVTRGVPDELIKESNTTLLEIDIPEGIELGQNVFANSKCLRRASIASENVGAGAFMMCTELKKLEMPNVVKIDDLAFFGDIKLNDITLSDKLVSIGRNAFDGSGLEVIELPASVKTVGDLAFSRCVNLRRASMPTDVMKNWAASLGTFSSAVKNKRLSFDTCDNMGVFFGCVSLEKINLKASDILRIGDFQFKGCEKLYELAKTHT